MKNVLVGFTVDPKNYTLCMDEDGLFVQEVRLPVDAKEEISSESVDVLRILDDEEAVRILGVAFLNEILSSYEGEDSVTLVDRSSESLST